MKELMLCVILFAAGAFAEIQKRHLIEGYEPAPCPDLCYTEWFDRDNPSGFGDYETLIHLLAENPGEVCKYPFAIEVLTLSGVNASATGQIFAYNDIINGFACVNSQQPTGRKCLDYKVRFICLCSDLTITKELWETE